MRRIFLAAVAAGWSCAAWGQFRPEIPDAWNAQALAAMTNQILGLKTPVQYAPAEWYHRIPERVIYRGYPVYRPDQEPQNYMNFLAAQTPEISFDVSKMSTESDWLRGGQAAFDSGEIFDLLTVDDMHDSTLWEKLKFRADREGALPGWRYVIRKPGKVEVAMTLCGGCHEGEVQGRTVAGTPNAFPIDAVSAYAVRYRLRHAKNYDVAARQYVDAQVALFSVPWLTPDPAEAISKMTAPQILSTYEAHQAKTTARAGTGLVDPPRIPDLIGVKDRKYLGVTGLYKHSGIADLMRYAILETGISNYTQYGDWRPSGELPDPARLTRLSDAQVYALAMYVYSLKAPPNPNRVSKDKTAQRGQQIFEREGCTACHPPPLYTDNKLMTADAIGTDRRLTTQTRVATGNYRVPSLVNVWYRQPIGHDGAVPTLEEWFDASRLKDTYQENRPVKGHDFGLKLSFEDRVALLTFLESR